MYDGIDISLDTDQIPQLPSLLERMGRYRVAYDRLNNLHVSYNQQLGRLRVWGSLRNYFFDGSGETLDLNSTKLCIERLSDELGMGVSAAEINQLEFGNDCLLRTPVSTVLNVLGEPLDKGVWTYRPPRQGKKTLYFVATDHELKFYDKKAELRAKRKKIPAHFNNVEALRYEVCLTGRIAEQLRVNRIRLADLKRAPIFTRLLHRWRREYYDLEKIKEFSVELITPIERKYQLLGVLAAKGAEDIILKRVLRSSFAEAGPTQRRRFNAAMRELNRLNYMRTSDVETELNTEIDRIYEKFYPSNL